MAPPSLHCDRCQTPLPDAFLNTPAPVALPGVPRAVARAGVPGVRAPRRRRRAPAARRKPSAATRTRAAFSIRAKRRSCPARAAGGSCARCATWRSTAGTCARRAWPTRRRVARSGGAAGQTVFANERTLYDQVALSLAVLPLLMWPLTLFCAPVAFYFAVRYWNSPRQGLIRRSRVRLVLAAVFALVEMAGWGRVRVLCVRRAHAHALQNANAMPPSDLRLCILTTFAFLS